MILPLLIFARKYLHPPSLAAGLNSPEAIFLPTSTRGRELAAMLAIDLNTGVLVDVTGVELSGDKLVVTRPIYSGKIFAKGNLHVQTANCHSAGQGFPKTRTYHRKNRRNQKGSREN